MSFFSTANKSLENNIAECNKGFQKVLYCSFAVPLVFLVLIKHSLLYMPFEDFFAISAFVMVVNIIEYFLNRDSASKNPVLQNISMYFGLISICLVIGMAGSFSIVPFYFAYAMPAIFSSVYLRKDVTNFITKQEDSDESGFDRFKLYLQDTDNKKALKKAVLLCGRGASVLFLRIQGLTNDRQMSKGVVAT